MEHCGIILTGQNQSTWTEACHTVCLSTTNPTWTGLGLSLNFHALPL
jgi:hypothetical protein